MRCLLAAFDQSHFTTDRTYWTWSHPELQGSLLDRFYYERAAKHLPDSATAIASDTIVGGCASIDSEWVCLYRFVDGGRDKQGRPGRRVLLGAFFKRCECAGQDLSKILESSQFREIARTAPTECPLPTPSPLEFGWNVPLPPERASHMRRQFLETGKADFEGPEALQDLFAVCTDIPATQEFDCHFVHQNGITKGSVKLCAASLNRPLVSTARSELRRNDSPEGNEMSANAVERESGELMSVRWIEERIIRQPGALIAGMILGISIGVVLSWSLQSHVSTPNNNLGLEKAKPANAHEKHSESPQAPADPIGHPEQKSNSTPIYEHESELPQSGPDQNPPIRKSESSR